MSLASNLLLAQAAVFYTEAKMTKGASNRPIDLTHARMRWEEWPGRRPSSPELKLTSVTAQRAQIKPIMSEVLTGGITNVDSALQIATLVEGSGIGNCGEQSMVAFKYLWEKTKTLSFSICSLDKGNHEFVIIGINSSDIAGVHPINQAPAWHNDVVVCDPWYNEWFAVATDWPRKLRSILNTTVPGHTLPSITLIPRVARDRINQVSFGW